MKLSQLSIRTTLFAIIGVLNILIILLVGSVAYRSWENFQSIQKLKRDSLTINLLYNTDKYLSLERGLSLAVMNAPSEIASSLTSDLMKDRQQSKDGLKVALSRIRSKPGTKVAMLVEKVKASSRRLEGIRKQIDQALPLTENRKQIHIEDMAFDAITSVITDIEALINEYSAPLLMINMKVSRQMMFKHSIWEITEYAGREYAQIGRLIVENQAPSPELRDRLISWNSRTELNWERSIRFAPDTGVQDRVSPYIEEAKTQYSVTFDQIKDMFYKTGPEQIAPPYPIGIDLWLEMATQATNSLIVLKDMVLQETQNYISEIGEQAKRDIIIAVLLLVSATMLSGYSFWVISQRVLGPVNKMVESLYRQAHDAVPNPSSDRLAERDEIEKLEVVLKAFKNNTQALERQKNYLKTVLATVIDAVISIDSRGTIQTINPAVEKMFGYTEKELVGQNVKILMPDSYSRHHDEYVRSYLETNEAKVIGIGRQVEARRKDGTLFPVDLALSEMVREGERMFVGLLHDITDRRKAEEEIKRYTKSLEDSNRELDDFAYIASHDLKEPLRGLHNFSRFLLEDYGEKMDEEGMGMLNTIADLTKRMDALLSSLLHYSRLGRTELSVRKTDLNETVRNAIAMYTAKIKERNADIQIVRSLPTIVCDSIRIDEVFQNLISNALKYNDKKDIKIEVGYRTDHPAHPGETVYFVKDNGIGIEQKNLENAFKIFRRLHPQDAYGGGTGSGLPIARKIITQHGGRIWAESEGKNKGTTFLFTIPSPAQEKDKMQYESAGKTGHVL